MRSSYHPDLPSSKVPHILYDRLQTCSYPLLAFTGTDDEGKPKFRAVDDFGRSQINACTAASEKLKYDTLDMFHETLRELNKHAKVRTCSSQIVSFGPLSFPSIIARLRCNYLRQI